MTLTQLYYFRTVAQLLNFHLAAKELMISQPSLSATIANLEEELGIKLFQRKGRYVELTKYGQLYFQEVTIILNRLDTVNTEMKSITQPGCGHIDLGYIAPLSPKYIPEKVQAFLKKPGYEKVKFGFHEMPTKELLNGLKQHKHDVVFCIYENGEPDVEFLPIMEQELVAIVPFGHPLAKKSRIQLKELAPYPLITYMPHVRLYREIMEYIAQSGWTPNIRCDATGEVAIAALVAHGFGVACVAKTYALEQNNVKVLHFTDKNYKRTIYMAFLKNEPLLPTVQAFISYIKNA